MFPVAIQATLMQFIDAITETLAPWEDTGRVDY